MKLAALALLTVVACAPPPPPGPAAWYDATADVIHYDDASMARTYRDYGQPGVDWIVAHEEGHRTTAYLIRNPGINLEDMMPGATVSIRVEQAAQCLAEATLGHGPPWQWGPAEVAEGYWDCPAEYVEMVEAAAP